jgi:hypothetical protein
MPSVSVLRPEVESGLAKSASFSTFTFITPNSRWRAALDKPYEPLTSPCRLPQPRGSLRLRCSARPQSTKNHETSGHRRREVGEYLHDVEVKTTTGDARGVRLQTAALVVVVLPKELPPKNGLPASAPSKLKYTTRRYGLTLSENGMHIRPARHTALGRFCWHWSTLPNDGARALTQSYHFCEEIAFRVIHRKASRINHHCRKVARRTHQG